MKNSQVILLLSVLQMWRFFSHFGVRALLVLCLVNSLQCSHSRAFEINAVFCALIELGGIFGGIIADRYLGLKKSVLIGGWLLTAGYFTLFLTKSLPISMGLIIAGSGLFSSNITALLGLCYTKEDSKRQKGFAYFYIMQNLGALASTAICGAIAIQYGFRWAFAISAMGIVIGNFLLLIYQNVWQTIQETPKNYTTLSTVLIGVMFTIAMLSVHFAQIMFVLLPWVSVGLLILFGVRLIKDSKYTKESVYQLLVYLGGLILFFAIEDQICSSLLLFAEKETSRTVFGWIIPSSYITTINPIVILLFGTFIAKKSQSMIVPFSITGAAFAFLALFCHLNLNLSILGIIGMVTSISLAELMIGPLVLSYTSEVAARGNAGMVMGIVPVAFSLAFQISGKLSKIVTLETQNLTLEVYGVGFGLIALFSLTGGLVIQLLLKKGRCKKKLMQNQ